MIKQPPQILKFFSSYLEVERDYNRKLKGTPGTHIVTEDILFIPPFQIKFNDRGEDVSDFLNNTIDLINYETGAITDLTAATVIRAMGVYTYDEYQNFVMFRFPLNREAINTAGLYYLKIADGVPGGDDSVEVWYSEVFELCDINRNLLRTIAISNGVTPTTWNDTTVTNYLSTRDFISVSVCESTANGAVFYQGSFYAIENEPLDFYCWGQQTTLACGNTTFLPLHFALSDSAGNIISNTIDGIEGAKYERFIPTKTMPATLKAWVDSGDAGRSNWKNYLFYANPQLFDGMGAEQENIGKYPVIRWSHSCNILDMIYENQESWIGDYFFSMAFENYLILDAVKDDEQNRGPSIVPQFEIEETVKEDDVFNKYNIVGVQKEWYALQIVTSVNLARAMQSIHFHDTVEFDMDGEKLVLDENRSELSMANDYNVLVKFIFREETLPVDACCFDTCCPNIENVIDYVSGGVAALPACAAGTGGDRYLVRIGGADGHIHLYECDGSNWNQRTDEEVTGNCVYNENPALTTIHYSFWSTDRWLNFAYLDSVTDNADGTATLNLRDGGKPDLIVQAQYSTDSGVTWTDCGTPYTITGTSDTVDCSCGAGANIQFRFHVYLGDCDYGYTNTHTETIT